MAQFTFNPFTGQFDALRSPPDTPSRIYLGDTTYLDYDGTTTVSLVINLTIVQQWTVSSATAGSGNPIGLLLALTYP